MIAVTSCEIQSQQLFSEKIQRYIKNGCSHSVQLTVDKVVEGKSMAKLGRVDEIPQGNINYLLNTDLMLAVSYAIEDMADGAGQGCLVSTFQKMENFEPQRERYDKLARSLDSVRVYGCGKFPSPCGKLEFIKFCGTDLAKYWIVLFTSNHLNAALSCKQINESNDFKEKLFVGFYTFNPFLVKSIHGQFNLLSVGIDKLIQDWQKEVNLPEISHEELNRYLSEWR